MPREQVRGEAPEGAEHRERDAGAACDGGGKKPEGDSGDGKASEPAFWRALVAELFGTFLLVAVAAGADVVAAVSHGKLSETARVTAPGLLIMALIYAIGDCSGAHFNPGVTFSFALRGAFPWKRVPAYWIAEIAGACLAALLLRSMFGLAGHLGATEPHHGVANALVMESLLSLILYCVILGTATRYSLVGPDAAIAVGAAIVLCGLVGDPISGASMNPARSLGPALVGGRLTYAWVYIGGPLIGSIAATGLTCLLHVARDPKEKEAASGDSKQEGKG